MTMTKNTKLFAAAKKIAKNAYSPYSKCKVGAAILSSKGKIYSGCNVENATYGATVCAERNAVAAMIAAGEVEIAAVAVSTKDGWQPCGICRQVLAEFITNPRKVPVHILSNKGLVGQYTLAELLPSAFAKKSLLNKK